MFRATALAVLIILAAWPTAAKPPVLDVPIRCTPDQDCWLVNLVDHDAGKGKKDFRCGRQTYNTHKGTDIAIATLAAMKRGVDVLAAAPGLVLGVRDGMRDVNVRTIGGPTALEGKDCGNGVMVDHGFGWTTQYCHLRKGSVAVKKGDKVARGQKIGLVGLSGRTEFPHIHMTVRRGKTVVDPFAGETRPDACARGPRPLWSPAAAKALTYKPARIYMAGFAARRPTGADVRKGEFETVRLTETSPVLIVWADTFWADKGDQLWFRLTDPTGRQRLDHKVAVKGDTARHMAYSGIKLRPGLRWPPGVWKADVRLISKGREIAHLQTAITVDRAP